MSHFNAKTLPEAVFWDWDGTIVDSYGFLNDAHNHTLQLLGFDPFKGDEYRQYFGKPRDVLYPAIYKEKHMDAMDVFQKYVFDNAHNIKTLSDVAQTLEFFHSRSIPMSIVSNKKANFIAEELKHTNFEKYFDTIIGAGDAKADKPSGAPLLMAIDKTKTTADPENIWYMGDTENDLACAQNVKCQALFLKGHADTEHLINQYKPLVSFDNYKQLTDFLVAM